VCLNFGLSDINGVLDIGLAENASSFVSPHVQGLVKKVQLRSVTEYIQNSNINRIDLMKINIEGGEFDVLPSLIKSGDISKVKNLQVQFHNFVEDAVNKRRLIRGNLEKTHSEMWNYEFIWESWRLRGLSVE
jgi:hypothetical protein